MKKAGGTGADTGTKICLDASGNRYSSIDSGNDTIHFNSSSFPVNGFNDIFIVKYDFNGNELWIKQFGGENTSMVNPQLEAWRDVKFDSVSNCLYVSGTFYQNCAFDTFNLNAGIGNVNSFVAKMDLNGNVLWAFKIGTGTAPLITLDETGNIYLAGSLLNSGLFSNIPIQSGGYFAKLDSSGSVLNLKHICRNGFQSSAYRVYSFQYMSNQIFINGNCSDTLTIDTIHLNDITTNSIVISAWDTSGNILWASHTEKANVFNGAMGVDDSSNLYISSFFQGSWLQFQNDTVYSSGNTGAFIAKLNKNGMVIWVKTIDVGLSYSALKIMLTSDQTFYIVGQYQDTLVFDNFSLISANGLNLFVARFDLMGTLIGAIKVDNATAYDLSEPFNGTINLVGEFGYNGSTSFGSISVTSYGSSDMFLANLSAITGSGGNERARNNQLIIYANPNKGSFKIKLPDAITDLTGAILIVYDVQGKEVARFNLEQTSDHPQLEINNAIAGLYTVRLVKGKQVFNGKLVVE